MPDDTKPPDTAAVTAAVWARLSRKVGWAVKTICENGCCQRAAKAEKSVSAVCAAMIAALAAGSSGATSRLSRLARASS